MFIGIGLILVGEINPFSTTGSTAGTSYYIDQAATEPSWPSGTDYWNLNNTAISLTYNASEDLFVRIAWNEYGTVTANYQLWYSTDNGATYTEWTNLADSGSGYKVWQINVDWSGWDYIKLTSTTDTSGATIPLRPTLASVIT